MHQPERAVPDYRKHAEALAEAIVKQEAASKSASLWQSLLEKSGDKYVRRYFQGQIELSRCRELHFNLVARSCQEAGHGRVLHSPANCLPLPSLAGGDKTQTNWDARDIKAASFSLLAECASRLGMERMAQSYETRARMENATARVHEKYETRPEAEVLLVAPGKSADLNKCSYHLESAGRSLGEYNVAYAKVMAHMRSAREFETAIEKMESATAHRSPNSAEAVQFEKARHQRNIAARLAETEAHAAISAHRNFQKEIQMAHKEYDSLSRNLAGKKPERAEPTLETTERSETLRETKGNLQGPGREETKTKVTETPTKEIDHQEPEAHPNQPGTNQTIVTNPQMRKVAISVVVSQVLRELDRGM